LPDLEHLLQELARELGTWTYLLVGAMAFLETGAFVGLVAPGEFSVILGGAVAGQGVIDLGTMLGIAWVCAFAGDSASFALGSRLGRDFVLRHGPRVRITRQRFEQVERYFASHGGKTILVGRFIGLVRALAPFIAGSSGMRYRAFMPFSVLGTGLWAATFTLLGFFFARSLDRVAEVVGQGTFLFGLVVFTVVGVVLAVRALRRPQARARAVAFMQRHALLRPLPVAGRALRPQARFLWGRITPGGLGLEFTSLLAAAAVGAYVVVLYAHLLSGNPGPTPGDGVALDIARRIEAPPLSDVVDWLVWFGRGQVVWAIAAVAGAWLLLRRRWTEAGVLIVGLAAIGIGVEELKELIARPRPADPLTGSDGFAFPSGHAAMSTAYLWLAVTVAIRVRPGLVGSTALIVTGAALTGAIGLSRVYLRVHYLSDVSAGWALGIAIFAAAAAVALLVSFLRQNSGRLDVRRDRT